MYIVKNKNGIVMDYLKITISTIRERYKGVTPAAQKTDLISNEIGNQH